MIPELPMIQALSVEGPALDIEPSTKSTSSVDGSTHEVKTLACQGGGSTPSAPTEKT